MKQTMKYLSIAALVAVGAIMMGCNKLDIVTEQTQQEEEPVISNTVTLTTTVSLDAATKALTAAGVKTFAAGETMALVYKNTSSATVKVVSTALTDGDITNAGKTATFTFELTDPDKAQNVTYIYPAAMANADGIVNLDALATQNGTLATLSSSLDLATYTGAWTGGTSLPAATLDNQLAILAITLKDNATPTANDITSTITGVTITEGTNTYAVTRTAAAGPIYVAIRPTTSADITVTATDGTTNYTKSLTGKTYAANNGYSVSWRMAVAVPSFSVSDSKKVIFSPGNLQYNGSESTYKWRFAENQYDVIGTWNTSTWVDLFGWGTWTGSSPDPTKTSYTNSDYTWDSADFSQEDILADATQRNYDWYTLSKDEWVYVFNTRTVNGGTGAGKSYTLKATVGSKMGIVLYPDNYTGTVYSGSDWASFEAAGCVFLPAAGYRLGTSVSNVGSLGRYGSSTVNGSYAAYLVYFDSADIFDPQLSGNHYYAGCVRLVRQVE